MNTQNKAKSTTSPQPTPLSDYIRNPNVSDDKRIDSIKPWLFSFKAARDQLSGQLRKDVEYVFQYLDKSCGLAIPVINPDTRKLQWLLKDMGNDDPIIHLAPLVKSDARFHPYLAHRASIAFYNEVDETLYLPVEEKVSSNGQALIIYELLLHGIYHLARQHQTEAESRIAEAYDAAMKMIKLARKLYGEPYSRTVYQLSRRFERQLRANTFIQHQEKVSPKLLEQVFGQTASDFERQAQETVIKIDALFYALNRLHPDGDKQEHYAIIKRLSDGLTAAVGANQ